MTALVDRPLEEWAVSRALFPTRLTQERCARKKKKTTRERHTPTLQFIMRKKEEKRKGKRFRAHRS